MPRITRRQPPPVPAPPPVQPVTTVITEPQQPIQTVYITAEPTAVRAAKSNGVPEIGGSQGGFIGLVVGLAVIMLVSCIGVFYLLKTRKGGGNPRKRLGQSRDIETSSGPSAVGGTVEMSFPSQGRFAGTFGGRGRSGWGRADSAEYDPVETADVVDEAGARYRDYKRTLDAAGGDAAAARHLRQDSASSSASPIRLEPPASPTDKADGPKTIGGSAEHPRYSQHVEPNGRRRATDDTLVSPTSIAHPLGVGGSKFHEMIT